MTVSIEDFKTLTIDGYKIVFPERIRQYETFEEYVAVRVNAKKEDPEYGTDLNGSNVFIANASGIKWQYPPKKGWISNIWKKDKKILCLYDGASDVWVDMSKLEVIKMVWNP